MDQSEAREEYEAKFRKVFNREMTPEERHCLILGNALPSHRESNKPEN
jgi:hypothetical protein